MLASPSSDLEALVDALAAHETLATQPAALLDALASVNGVQPMDVIAAALSSDGVHQLAYTLGLRAGERMAAARFNQLPPDAHDVMRMRQVVLPYLRAVATAIGPARPVRDMFASGFWQGLVTQVVRVHDRPAYRAARDRAAAANTEQVALLQAQVQALWPDATRTTAFARELLVVTAELSLTREALAATTRAGWEVRYHQYRQAGYSGEEAVQAVAGELAEVLQVSPEQRAAAERFLADHAPLLAERLSAGVTVEEAPDAVTERSEGVGAMEQRRWRVAALLGEVVPDAPVAPEPTEPNPVPVAAARPLIR